MTKSNIDKALKVASKLGINVKELDTKLKLKPRKGYTALSYWKGGKTIYIDFDKATNYIILHEIGHVINGYMCCTEHCEYAAHGSAMALAKLFNIKLGPLDKTKINVYAGWTKKCPVKKLNENQ